jgi:DHA2 family multidrug resistance protein
MATQAIYHTLLDQASLWAYIDNFRLYAYLSFLCIPLALMFKKVKPKNGVLVAH